MIFSLNTFFARKLKSDTTQYETARKSVSWSDFVLIAADKLRNLVISIRGLNSGYLETIEKTLFQINKQSSLVKESRNICNGTKKEFQEVTGEAANIAAIAEELHVLSNSEKSRIIQALNQIYEIKDSVIVVDEAIAELEQQSQKIEQFTSVITNIAESIRIIALNASLAASKAEGFGGSFKVVADQMKLLSLSTVHHVTIIYDALKNVRETTLTLSEQKNVTIQETETIIDLVNKSSGKLDLISNTIDTVSKNSGAMKLSVMQLGEKNSDILHYSEKIDQLVDSVLGTSNTIIDKGNKQYEALTALQTHVEHFCEKSKQANNVFDRIDRNSSRVLRVLTGKYENFDPALNHYTFDMQMNEYIFIKLVRYSEDKRIIPYLAQQWYYDNQEKSWYFKICENIKFHDGSVITAEDVRFSFERALHPDLKSSKASMFSLIDGFDEYAEGKVNHIRGIHVIDPLTIVFTLKYPYNFFLGLLAMDISSIVSRQSGKIGQKINTVISAGPFRYEGYDTVRKCHRLQANQDFLDGAPYISMLELVENCENTYESFINKEIDICNIDIDLLNNLTKHPRYNRCSQSFDTSHCITLNVNYSKNHVFCRHSELRRALCMAIDKKRIISEVFRGNGTVAHAVIPPALIHAEDICFIPYDPTGARNIINAYKQKEDISGPFTFLCLDSPEFVQTSSIIIENLREVGIEIQMEIAPKDKKNLDFLRQFDFILLVWSIELDMYLALEAIVNPDGVDNVFSYKETHLFESLKKSLYLKSQKERELFFAEIIRDVAMEVVRIPLVYKEAFYAFQPHVQNIRIAANDDLNYEHIIVERIEQQKFSPSSGRMLSSLVSKPELVTNLCQQHGALESVSDKIDSLSTMNTAIVSTISETMELLRNQLKHIEMVYSASKELIVSSKEEKDKTIQMLQVIDEACRETRDEQQLLTRIITSLDTLTVNIESVIAIVTHYQETLGNIANQVKKVRAVTDQFNSLSVNAIIISSKVQDKKNNLTAVANEIRELGRQTHAEIEKIEELVHTMMKLLKNTIEKIMDSFTKIESSTATLHTSNNGMQRVLANVEKTNRMTDGISRKMDMLMKSIQTMLDSMDKTQDFSQHISQVIESVNISSELQVSVFDSLVSMYRNQKDIFSQLQRCLQESTSHNALLNSDPQNMLEKK